MRAVAVTAMALLLVALANASSDMAERFETFKVRYGRKYASGAEEARRFKIFAENMEHAKKLMQRNPRATFGENEFADMTKQEFKSRHNADKYYAGAMKSTASKPVVSMSAAEKKAASGESIDWVKKGAVTHVKNQGQCGSCWSFSTTGGVEGQWFLAGNPLTSLSEQEFVSCDTIDNGCNGGLMDNAFQWVINNNNGTLVTAASYPYQSGDGYVPQCQLSGKTFGAQIYSYENIAHNENDMAAWVYKNGPLSVAVDAQSWMSYTGGVITNCDSVQIDHGVLVVGFDDSTNPPYWLIKNSWGPGWGLEGYLKVEKGTDQCLITTYPCSSKVHKGPMPPPPTHQPGPTSPPQPTTAAPSGTFTQKQCQNAECTQGCQSRTFQQGACLQLASGGSAKATCTPTELNMEVYLFSTDCSGMSFSEPQPINQCTQDENGSYFENLCSGSSSGVSAATVERVRTAKSLAKKRVQ